MSSVMSQLEADHVNVSRLLDILEEQIARVRAEQHSDFELMHNVMIYMTDYPDRVHHPAEDLVFRRLLMRDESLRKPVNDLTREHRALGEKGQAFRDVLEHVVDGALVPRERVLDLGSDYVAFLRAHMSREDREVFPRAREALTEADWKWVLGHIERREDPVFGPLVAEQFRSLLEFIRQQSE